MQSPLQLQLCGPSVIGPWTLCSAAAPRGARRRSAGPVEEGSRRRAQSNDPIRPSADPSAGPGPPAAPTPAHPAQCRPERRTGPAGRSNPGSSGPVPTGASDQSRGPLQPRLIRPSADPSVRPSPPAAPTPAHPAQCRPERQTKPAGCSNPGSGAGLRPRYTARLSYED